MQKKLKPQDIYGINPIAAMPFTSQGEVDYQSFEDMLRHLATTGCHGITLFGIASEFYKLSDNEKNRLAEIFLATVSQQQVYRCISVTEHATELAVKQAQTYQAMGADCLMLLPPFFLQPDNQQVEDHIHAVLASVDIPVLVQYAPSETGVPIPPEHMAEIAREYPNAVFKIECNPPVDYSKSLLELVPEAVILNGYAGLYMPDMLTVGGKGVMPGCSFTEVYVEIYHRWVRGEYSEAKELHQRLLHYIRPWMGNCEYIIQVEKSILQRRGIISSDYCRRPAYPLSPEDQVEIDNFIEEFLTDKEL